MKMQVYLHGRLLTIALFFSNVLAVGKEGNMSSSRLHKVFVYGTLKKGEPNHRWLTKSTDSHCKYLFEAKTKEKYPLVISTEYNIPFLLLSPGNGTEVKGEVYEVDDRVLADLDVLEEHPSFYVRDLYDVVPLDDPNNAKIKVWIYMIKNYNENLVKGPFYESYSNAGSHGKKYVERYFRKGCYKATVLKNVS